MRYRFIRWAAALAILLSSGGAQGEERWLQAEPGYRWSFPRDHFAHPGYRNEWWYFTGHLAALDEPGRRFGYQFTFFRVGLLPAPPPLRSAWSSANLVMGHAALADLSSGERRFGELLYRETPFLGGFGCSPGPVIAWSWAPAGTDGTWTLAWKGGRYEIAMTDQARGFTLELTARPSRPLVFEGPDGYSRKARAPGFASEYVSFTRLETEGTVTLGGRTWKVTGASWMDQEFGSSPLAPGEVGWDWFGLTLADGRDLMLYVLRRADGSADSRSATLVGRDGRARLLAPEEWSVAATGSWESPRTGTRYPAGWRVEVPSERLRILVQPELADQENRSALVGEVAYWEGAVRVSDEAGQPAGEGYVELTGYGKEARPPL